MSRKPNGKADLARIFQRHPATMGGQVAALDKEPHHSLFLEVIAFAEKTGEVPMSDNRLRNVMADLCEERGYLIIRSATTYMRYLHAHPEIAKRIGRA